MRTYNEQRQNVDRLTIGEDFVRAVLTPLVDEPDELHIKAVLDERGIFIVVEASYKDRGRIIGRKGATIEAVRMLLRALGTKQDAFYSVKVQDDA